MLYKLKKDNPDKMFYLPSPNLVCPTMKLTTLGWVMHSLETMENEIRVPLDIAKLAKKSLDKMLEVTGESEGATIAGY